MPYETTSYGTDRPLHIRAKALADRMMASIETGAALDADSVSAFAELYSALVADKTLSFEMQRHRGVEAAERRRFEENRRAIRRVAGENT